MTKEFTYSTSERDAEVKRKKGHDKDIRVSNQKKNDRKKEDSLGISEYNEELALKLPDKKYRQKENSDKKQVLLQSRLTTARIENSTKFTDFQVTQKNSTKNY